MASSYSCPESSWRPADRQIYLNDLDVSADYIERLMEEIISNLPQVFIDKDLPVVEEELRSLANLSSRFRTTSKVSQERTILLY